MADRPFDASPWFPIHNWVFDVAMRNLSPTAWKVLCVAIRQTWGWADPETDSGRKESDRISYSQFREKSGIASNSTIRKALQECITAGYIIREQTATISGTGAPIYAYALNRDYSTSTESVPGGVGTDSVLAPGTDSVLAPGTDSVKTKTKKANKQKIVVVVPTAEQEALDELLAFGFQPRNDAEQYVAALGADDVTAWLAYAGAHDLGNGFLRKQFDAGAKPPPMEPDPNDRRRFIEGEFANIIRS